MINNVIFIYNRYINIEVSNEANFLNFVFEKSCCVKLHLIATIIYGSSHENRYENKVSIFNNEYLFSWTNIFCIYIFNINLLSVMDTRKNSR